MDSWEIFEINDFTDSSDYEKFISLIGKYLKEWSEGMDEYKNYFIEENPGNEWLKREQILNYGQDCFMLSFYMIIECINEFLNVSEKIKPTDATQLFASKTHHLNRWFGCDRFLVLKRLKPSNSLDILKSELLEDNYVNEDLRYGPSDIPLSASQTYTLLSALSLAMQNYLQGSNPSKNGDGNPASGSKIDAFTLAGVPSFVCINEGTRLYEGTGLGPSLRGRLASNPDDVPRVNYRMMHFTQPLTGLAYYDDLVELFGRTTCHVGGGSDLPEDAAGDPPLVSLCFTLTLRPTNPQILIPNPEAKSMGRALSQPPPPNVSIHGGNRNRLAADAPSYQLHDTLWRLGSDRHPLCDMCLSFKWLHIPTKLTTDQSAHATTLILEENAKRGSNLPSYADALNRYETSNGPTSPRFLISIRGNGVDESDMGCLLTSKLLGLVRLVQYHESGLSWSSPDPEISEPFLDPGDYMRGDTLENLDEGPQFSKTAEPRRCSNASEDLQRALDRMLEVADSGTSSLKTGYPRNAPTLATQGTRGGGEMGGAKRPAIPDALMDQLFWILFPDSKPATPIPHPPQNSEGEEPSNPLPPLIDENVSKIELPKKLKIGPSDSLVDRLAHVIFFLSNWPALDLPRPHRYGADRADRSREHKPSPGVTVTTSTYERPSQGSGTQGASLAVLKEFWREFVLELRYRWDNSIPLPSVEKGKPNFHYDLFYQKLQMLNCCIELKIRHNPSSPDSVPEKNFNSGPTVRVATDRGESLSDDEEQFYECQQQSPDRGPKSPRPKESQAGGGEPEGRSHTLGDGVKLLNGTDLIYVPITQEPPLMTEDQVELYLKVLTDTATHADPTKSTGGAGLRAELQSSSLRSDMQAFKAANPTSGDMRDFLRWYSPSDLVWDDATKANDDMSDAAITTPRCTLSRRMLVQDPPDHDNIWVRLWEHESPAQPVSRQRRHFDEVREGEKVLHYLAHLSLHQLIVDVTLPYLARYAYQILRTFTSTLSLPSSGSHAHTEPDDDSHQILLNSCRHFFAHLASHTSRATKASSNYYQHRSTFADHGDFEHHVLPHLATFETAWARYVFAHRFVRRYALACDPVNGGAEAGGRDVGVKGRETCVIDRLLDGSQIDLDVLPRSEDNALVREIRASGCDFVAADNLKLLVDPDRRSDGGRSSSPSTTICDGTLRCSLVTKEYVFTRPLGFPLRLYALVGKSEFRVAKVAY